MNVTDFELFANAMRSQAEGDERGYYPTMIWTSRISVLWFKTLQRFPLAKALRALELHYMMDPEHPPKLEQFLLDVQALVPPQTVPWQQFAPAQERAMEHGGYGQVLRSLLPEPGSTAWAKCWIWLFEQELMYPGREIECAKACRRFAERYPRDREDWLRHACRLEDEATRNPLHPPRIRRDPMPLDGAFAPESVQYDHTFGGEWISQPEEND